ncbi:MAG: AMP-binding protein [Acidimicrobiia bacterium]|nr:AMP-binding protein [Acidimicrobiia bacterium]
MKRPPPPPTVNLADLFELVVRAVPRRVALTTPAASFTYGQLDGRANQLARLLQLKGIGPGDHVGIVLPTGLEHIEGVLATLKLRAHPVAVSPELSDATITRVLDECGARGVLHRREDLERVGAMGVALEELNFFVVVEDASGLECTLPNAVFYEEGLASYEADMEFGARSGDDLHVTYAVGDDGALGRTETRHEEVVRALRGGAALARPEALLDELVAASTTTAPDRPMAETGGLGVLRALLRGATVELAGPY